MSHRPNDTAIENIDGEEFNITTAVWDGTPCLTIGDLESFDTLDITHDDAEHLIIVLEKFVAWAKGAA